MSLPELSKQDYAKAVEELGEEPSTAWLQELDPDHLWREDWNIPESKGLIVVYLNVAEPHMFVGHSGRRIVLPYGSPTTYDMLEKVWPMKTRPWGFVIRENLYDPLDDMGLYFRYGNDEEDGRYAIPAYKREDVSTH